MILLLTVSGRGSIPRNIFAWSWPNIFECFTPIPWEMINLTIFSRRVDISSNYSLMSYFTPVLFQSIRGSFGGYPSSEFAFCLWSQPMSSIPFTTGCLLTEAGSCETNTADLAIGQISQAASQSLGLTSIHTWSSAAARKVKWQRVLASQSALMMPTSVSTPWPWRAIPIGSLGFSLAAGLRPKVLHMTTGCLLVLVFQPDSQTSSSLLNHTQPPSNL